MIDISSFGLADWAIFYLLIWLASYPARALFLAALGTVGLVGERVFRLGKGSRRLTMLQDGGQRG